MIALRNRKIWIIVWLSSFRALDVLAFDLRCKRWLPVEVMVLYF